MVFTTNYCSIPTNHAQRRYDMTDTHCPGFESNKSLKEIKIKCSACGKEWEIFSDELEKSIKCSACGALIDPKDQQD